MHALGKLYLNESYKNLHQFKNIISSTWSILKSIDKT